MRIWSVTRCGPLRIWPGVRWRGSALKPPPRPPRPHPTALAVMPFSDSWRTQAVRASRRRCLARQRRRISRNGPDSVRGVPNAFLRSALFSTMRRGPRTHLHDVVIASVQGTEILYSGEPLDQGDLDVWEMLVHHLREHTLGSKARLTAYQMLRWLGKQDTGCNRQTLDARLNRLHGNTLHVRGGRYKYQGSLVDDMDRDEVSREYVIRLKPGLHELFATDQYTGVDAVIRRALDGQQLAQWLHGFYSSHAAPLPISVRALHQLCGSSAKRIDHFRQDLRNALSRVTDRCKANGQEFSAEIIEDLVHVKRTPSRSQRQHLARKRTTTPQQRRPIPS